MKRNILEALATVGISVATIAFAVGVLYVTLALPKAPLTEAAVMPTPKVVTVDTTNMVLQASVRVKTSGTGTGVLLQRGSRTWVLTAAHCVADMRTGDLYDGLEVSRAVYQSGYEVGRITYHARVIEYSVKEDLALLLLDGTAPGNTRFAPQYIVPRLGTPLMHVGNLIGVNEQSFVVGLLSGYGRTLMENHFWQTSVDAWPGSSGGGVYTLDGQLVGLLTMGSGPTLNYIIPVSRIHAWACLNKLDWIFQYECGGWGHFEEIVEPKAYTNIVVR
jgi:S1-C subfamily serine protease